MISALREDVPHEDFALFANQNRRKPESDDRPIPQSPIFCRFSGFFFPRDEQITPSAHTLELLDQVRRLTNSFARGPGASFISPLTPIRVGINWDHSPDSVSTLRDQIWDAWPRHIRANHFVSLQDAHIFEAIRLVGVVYAHALMHEVPLSKAADMLKHDCDRAGCSRVNTRRPDQNTSHPSTSRHGSGAFGNADDPSKNTTPLHVRVKNELIRTDMSDCWGSGMRGVLFWLALVASACASREGKDGVSEERTDDTTTSSTVEQESEEARQWLAAIAVRCSILLSFEHGGAVLETLKRMVAIERALAKADEEREAAEAGQRHTTPQHVSAAAVPHASMPSSMPPPVYGPEMSRRHMLGFHDFSQNFEGAR